MWVEAGQPAHTFWDQTQRSFANVLSGAAKRDLAMAWKIAALTASASAGKLPRLEELMEPARTSDNRQRGQNAKLLHALFALKAKGIHMEVERVERLH